MFTSPSLGDIIPLLSLPDAVTTVVDIGCGTGGDVRWLAGAGFSAVGVDVDASVLARAAGLSADGLDVQWVEASATSVPLDDASCALVTDRGCLHHLSGDERHAYAGEVSRLLAPDGVWLIRDVLGHHGQVAELGEPEIERLARGLPLTLESCARIDEQSAHGTHTWLIAVLRRAA